MRLGENGNDARFEAAPTQGRDSCPLFDSRLQQHAVIESAGCLLGPWENVAHFQTPFLELFFTAAISSGRECLIPGSPNLAR